MLPDREVRFRKTWHYWRVSAMRISINCDMERRVGLFPAGFDADGELFCSQNFADYPFRVPSGKSGLWSVKPEWMPLSYGKSVTASSTAEGSSFGYSYIPFCPFDIS